ncbi:MAG: phosphoribosyltransferase family protein [Thermoanaerobaculia bacterium]
MLRDRREAGLLLARELRQYANRPDVVVLGLPRGGVPVAFEVATALNVPLDVFLVRKLGLPGHEEFAIGALASGGLRVLNLPLIKAYSIPEQELAKLMAREKAELERREREYRAGLPPLEVAGKTVILVDDGLATGASMQAAVMALKQARPARVVVAVPVAPPEACEALRSLADEVVCALTPEPFQAVGRWYGDFEQTTDGEVKALLERGRARALPGSVAQPATSEGAHT